MYTLFKFICVGGLNTALDFLVLNALIAVFGTGGRGELFVLFKALSFLAAVANSYFLNKMWVFDRGAASGAREPALFFIVSALGLAVNISVSFAVFAAAAHALSQDVAANVGALAGTLSVFAWNFIGYRFFVFKKQLQETI